jgi:hypothetical protein
MKALCLLAVVVALSGCSAFEIPTIPAPSDMAVLDECSAAPQGRSCVTLHLRGNVDPIDTVQIDAIFELDGEYVARRTVSHYAGGAVEPPIAVGVILTENAGPSVELKALASAGGTPVAFGGEADVLDLRPGDHQAADLTLIAVARSLCFDGIKDQDEVDVDCGWAGECPVCTVGNICISSRDCANSTCADDGTGTYTYRCQ